MRARSLLQLCCAAAVLAQAALRGPPAPRQREPGATRLKRKNLSLDFILSATLRTALRDLLGVHPTEGQGRWDVNCVLTLECGTLMAAVEQGVRSRGQESVGSEEQDRPGVPEKRHSERSPFRVRRWVSPEVGGLWSPGVPAGEQEGYRHVQGRARGHREDLYTQTLDSDTTFQEELPPRALKADLGAGNALAMGLISEDVGQESTNLPNSDTAAASLLEEINWDTTEGAPTEELNSNPAGEALSKALNCDTSGEALSKERYTDASGEGLSKSPELSTAKEALRMELNSENPMETLAKPLNANTTGETLYMELNSDTSGEALTEKVASATEIGSPNKPKSPETVRGTLSRVLKAATEEAVSEARKAETEGALSSVLNSHRAEEAAPTRVPNTGDEELVPRRLNPAPGEARTAPPRGSTPNYPRAPGRSRRWSPLHLRHQELRKLAESVQSDHRHLSTVLNEGSVGTIRRSKQLVLPLGQALIQKGCSSGRTRGEEPRGEQAQGAAGGALHMNLTELFDWWLRTGAGRLRVRLMPERTVAAPEKEERLAEAIRDSHPRLAVHIFRKAQF